MEEEIIATSTNPAHQQSGKVTLLVSLGLFLCSLNIGMFFFSMPFIAKSLQVQWSQVAWSLVVYFIIIAAFLNLFRQAAKRHGGIRILRLGALLFAIGSLMCAFSQGWVDLLFYRLVQAFGAACLQATVFGLFLEYIPLSGYPVAVHRSSVMLFFGLVLGFLLGAAASYWLSWQWAFVVLAVSALALYLFALPVKCATESRAARYDFVGIGLFLLIMLSFFLGLGLAAQPHVTHPRAHIIFMVSVVALLVFFVYESRREDPFMKLSLYRDPGFSLTMLAKFVHAFVTTLFFILPVVYMVYVRDFSMINTLWVALMAPLGVTMASLIDYGLSKKYKGNWLTAVATVFFVVPVVYICLIDAGSVNGYSVLLVFIFGLGSGLLQQFLLRITFEVLQESAPRVGTTYRAIHNLGCAFAVVVSVFFMVKYWLAEWDNLNAGISYTLYTALVLIIIVLFFAALRGVACWIGKSRA
jgi:MFS family permease